MPQYRIAQLSQGQMENLRSTEENLGLVLIAYEEPAGATTGSTSAAAWDPDDDDTIVNSLLDTYQTYDPH